MEATPCSKMPWTDFFHTLDCAKGRKYTSAKQQNPARFVSPLSSGTNTVEHTCIEDYRARMAFSWAREIS
jgi:hypothetical protein